MSIESQPVAYLLLRNYWDAAGDRYACIHEPGEGWPVLAFRNRMLADARCDELERVERLKVDPVHYSNVGPQIDTNSGATQQARLVTEADEIGVGRVSDGADWWHAHKLALSAAQLRATWHELGGGQFYEVVAVDFEGEPTAAGAVHVVRKLAWIWDELGLHTNRGRDVDGRIEFGRPVRAFADPLAAEAFRTVAERAARVGQNPFTFASDGSDAVAGRASLEYPMLRDWLLDCGLPRVPKPSAGDDVWLRWWRRHIPHLSPLQQAKAWEAFDPVRFYDVVEVELDSGRSD